MNEKLIKIPLTKTTIFLTEAEILSSLRASIFSIGIKRGKAIKRCQNQNIRIKNLVGGDENDTGT